MKRIPALLLLTLLTVAFASGQDAKTLFKNRFSYDLSQDRMNVKFDGKTFWLRTANLKGETLTLTYFLKGDTPTTAREVLIFSLLPLGVSVDDYVNQLIAEAQRFNHLPPDIQNFNGYEGGEQKILSSLIEDKDNNLLEDDIVRMTRLNGQKLRVAIHMVRMKLTEAAADPEKATALIGDRRTIRMLEIAKLNFPF